MAEDYERLQKRIEDGLDAVRELKRLEEEARRRKRPKLRLIRGGLIGGAIWAGVEWLRDYKVAVAVAATAAGVAGGVIADRPHTPGGDPPTRSILKPATPRPSAPPTFTPQAAAPSLRRTSPPRTAAARPTLPERLEASRASIAKKTQRPDAKPPSEPPRPQAAAPKTVPPPKATARPSLNLPVKKPPVKTIPTPTVSVTVTVPTVTPIATCAVVEILDLCILG